jgi:hypothetical protein
MTQVRLSPVVFAAIVAIFGVLALLIVDHGPWSKPLTKQSTNTIIKTDDATKAAGATVAPTVPQSTIEPVAPGPKPVQPATVPAK